mmetsp:Transcript_16902/g.58233  ORF Transcript_16902/g.58233 Transcript_16902/m.58233 type:complete len:209 (+) Transcript_16902:460-1086(+)
MGQNEGSSARDAWSPERKPTMWSRNARPTLPKPLGVASSSTRDATAFFMSAESCARTISRPRASSVTPGATDATQDVAGPAHASGKSMKWCRHSARCDAKGWICAKVRATLGWAASSPTRFARPERRSAVSVACVFHFMPPPMPACAGPCGRNSTFRIHHAAVRSAGACCGGGLTTAKTIMQFGKRRFVAKRVTYGLGFWFHGVRSRP